MIGISGKRRAYNTAQHARGSGEGCVCVVCVCYGYEETLRPVTTCSVRNHRQTASGHERSLIHPSCCFIMFLSCIETHVYFSVPLTLTQLPVANDFFWRASGVL